MTTHDEPRADAANRKPGLAFKLLAVPLVTLSAVLGLGFAKWCRTSCYEPAPTAPQSAGPKLSDRYFQKWEKPDFVLLLSGQQHGYLLPCGCSDPQYGGLVRRYNLVQMLRARGWDVVAVDVGDVPQMKGPAGLANVQGQLKYATAMKAMKAIGYKAVGVGEYEAVAPLSKLMDEWALNEPEPRILAANLTNRDEYPGQIFDWKLAQPKKGGLKVGITVIVGPIVEEKVKAKDPTPKFGDTAGALNKALAEMAKEGVDLPVLLYQGYVATPNKQFPKMQPEGIECAKAFPQFRVMLCLDESDEPPANPLFVDQGPGKPKTLVARVGHKAKYVSVVGVYKTGKPNDPFEFRYQSIELGEEFNTPKGEEAQNPVARLMEDYTKELKNGNYLAQYPQTKHPFAVAMAGSTPEYVGSSVVAAADVCKKCHGNAYDVWKSSKHSHAYQTLVKDAKNPSNRQFDAECIVCHTVGFGYKSGFESLEKTPKLINVGCESCHGPASEHVKNPQNKDWYALLNPWKPGKNETPAEEAKRINLTDAMCQRCHDSDNDVTWTHKGFERKWPLIDH